MFSIEPSVEKHTEGINFDGKRAHLKISELMSRFIWVSPQVLVGQNASNTAQTLCQSSMLTRAENNQAFTFKSQILYRKNWLSFKLSLQSHHWPSIAACGGWHQGRLMPQQIWGSCSHRSADMQLSTAPTVGRRRRGNPDSQGEPNTYTHTHSLFLRCWNFKRI